MSVYECMYACVQDTAMGMYERMRLREATLRLEHDRIHEDKQRHVKIMTKVVCVCVHVYVCVYIYIYIYIYICMYVYADS